VMDERRALELVRMLRADPHAAEVAAELFKLSTEAKAAGSPKQYTYNKLWHLIEGCRL